jgi:clan AA aspartic protease
MIKGTVNISKTSYKLKNMGEIRADITLHNTNQLYREKKKLLKKKKTEIKVNVLVDTGAVMTLLPEEIVEKLDLMIIDKRMVTLADDSTRIMNIAGSLTLTVCGRTMGTDCIVGPPGCEPLIGQVVMETLDLVLDPLHKTMTVRPESPFLPTLKLK